MSERQLSAQRIIGVIVAFSFALLLFNGLVRLTWSPPPGEGIAFSPLLLLAQLALLLGSFYLSVGIILGLWSLLAGELNRIWPKYSIVLTPIIVTIGAPVVTIGVLAAFGLRTGFQYVFAGFFIMTLPLVTGLTSKKSVERRPLAIVSGLLYLGFILLYFAGVPIWPMTPTSGPLLIDLVIPIGFVIVIYLVSAPLYFAGVRLRSVATVER